MLQPRAASDLMRGPLSEAGGIDVLGGCRRYLIPHRFVHLFENRFASPGVERGLRTAGIRLSFEVSLIFVGKLRK